MDCDQRAHAWDMNCGFFSRVTRSGTPCEIDRALNGLVQWSSSQAFKKMTGDLHPVLLPSSSGATLTERLGVCVCVTLVCTMRENLLMAQNFAGPFRNGRLARQRGAIRAQIICCSSREELC